MKPNFDHTVAILVKAYLNDELAHGFCSACAVGNIVAAAIGTKPKALPGHAAFDNVCFDDGSSAASGWYNQIKEISISTVGVEQVLATGYSEHELNLMEVAFEKAPGRPCNYGISRKIQLNPTWMFNGLMAVVDVLAEIHGVDLSQKEQAKLLFQK